MVTTFTDFINIAGAIGSVTVAFVIPELIYLKVFKDKLSFSQKSGCVMIAVFGICGSVYSVYFSILKMTSQDYSWKSNWNEYSFSLIIWLFSNWKF